MGGMFGCEHGWGSVHLHVSADVWVYIYYPVSGYLGMECAGCGGRCWVQRCGWGLVWCVWVQGYVWNCESCMYQASRWIVKLCF